MIAIDPTAAARPANARPASAGADQGAFRAALADARERGASPLAGGAGGAAAAAPSAAEQEFMGYASMSLQEKMFYAALAALGISKEDYDAMSAADKLKVAEKVSLMMQQLAKAEQVKQTEQAGRAA